MPMQNEKIYKDWCTVDNCPASICNGPHIAHRCPNGDLVTCRFDNITPCPFCGWVVVNLKEAAKEAHEAGRQILVAIDLGEDSEIGLPYQNLSDALDKLGDALAREN